MQSPDTEAAQNAQASVLYERFAETILAYLCQQVSHRQDAEDLLQVQVNPHMPQNRILSLQMQYGQVIIGVPAGTNPQLLSMQTISCEGYHGGNTRWTLLATRMLQSPACPKANAVWEYIVSAPGYAISYGKATLFRISTSDRDSTPCGCTPTPAILPVHTKP